jgi:hypothetical protein
MLLHELDYSSKLFLKTTGSGDAAQVLGMR